MKKMVCEICGSQKIRKENSVFVCQDCGTEYSLEEAKKLLKEVGEDSTKTIECAQSTSENKIIQNDDNKYVLLQNLKDWLVLISSFKDVYFWIGKDAKIENLCSTNFQNMKETIINAKQENFPILNNDLLIALINDTIDNFTKIKLAQFYGTSDKVKLAILNNPTISNINSFFSLHSYKKCYVNGEAFPKYMVYANGNYKTGLPMETMHNNLKLWHIGVDDLEKGIKFEIAVSETTRGFFGDRVMNTTIYGSSDMEKFLNTAKLVTDQVIVRNNNLKVFYEKNFEDMKQTYINLINKFDELANVFDLPLKYRNINDIYLLINYLKDGRVDNWKEAINLLELEKHQQNLLIHLDDINNTISTLTIIIERNLKTTNELLFNMSNKLSSISSKLSNCEYSLKQIMYDTRLDLIWN